MKPPKERSRREQPSPRTAVGWLPQDERRSMGKSPTTTGRVDAATLSRVGDAAGAEGEGRRPATQSAFMRNVGRGPRDTGILPVRTGRPIEYDLFFEGLEAPKPLA